MSMMKRITPPPGMSILQVLVVLSLSALFVRLASLLMFDITTSTSKRFAETAADQELQTIKLFLKKAFGGVKSFQNVRFRVPAGQSSGPGFLVIPDSDFDANGATQSDLAYAIVKIPTETDIKLNTVLTQGTSPIDLVPLNATVSIANLISANDTLVITNNLDSDVFSAVLTGTPGRFTLNSTAYANTFSGTGSTASNLFSTYVVGDYVYKAEIQKIGLDVAAKELRAVRYTGGTPFVFGRNVTRFQIFYSLAPPNGVCTTVTPAAGVYERSQWSLLNTGSAYTCYKRLIAVRVEFDVEYTSRSGVQQKQGFVVIDTTNQT